MRAHIAKDNMTEQMDTPPDAAPVPSRVTFEGPKGPLFKAMADARRHYKSLVADSTADVQLKGGGGYKHSYAPLDSVIAALQPGWDAAGLAVSQPFDGDSLWTIVAKDDSAMIVQTAIPQWDRPQELGSALTYLRRYQLKGVFCVNDSEDDDGNAASGNTAKVDRKQPSAPKPSGPNVPKDVIDEVFAAAKDKGLPKAEFYARAKAVCGKDWLEFAEVDAKKLLADLVMK